MKVCRLSFVMAFKHLPTTVMIFLSYSVCGIVIAAAAKTAVDEPDVSSASFSSGTCINSAGSSNIFNGKTV